ncbi:MAG: NUDIX hydrolase [Gammaproteobacteria bacterium]|nr:NUDIX hydrolase [Gammaproteobacteria bacterium]
MALFTRNETVQSERIFDGQIIGLRLDTLKHPTGKGATREVVEHNGGVVIACQPEPNSVILIRQYRYPVDQVLIELPAGRIDGKEDPLLAAQRELREETGYNAKSWTELVRMYTAPGFCDEILYLYKAYEIDFVGKCLDEDEETDVFIATLEEARDLVRQGKVKDAKTIAGLSLLG